MTEKKKNKTGRPKGGANWHEDWKNEFCERMAHDLLTVDDIAKHEDMPSAATIYNELRDDAEFLELYSRARERRADVMAKDVLEIADAKSNDATNRDRLRVDTRKWLMAHMAPSKYGKKLAVEAKTTVQTDFDAMSDTEKEQLAKSKLPAIKALLAPMGLVIVKKDKLDELNAFVSGSQSN